MNLIAVASLSRLLPPRLRKLIRGLGWSAVIILALRTIPGLIVNLLGALTIISVSSPSWFWNTWFAAWLLAFFPAMKLSRPTLDQNGPV
ncbi:MAG: hypothetical protein LBG99_02915 [Propionibacteriaceae bacterium]|nr:hypothetical protein [Propionibacteriaceae bacterium]